MTALAEAPAGLDAVADRHLLHGWASPTCLLREIEPAGCAACWWEAPARRIEVVFRSGSVDFVRGVLQRAGQRAETLTPPVKGAYVLAESPAARAILARVTTAPPVEQVTLVLDRADAGEDAGVRPLHPDDAPALAGYPDEHASVFRLFDFHCRRHPSPSVLALGAFGPQGQLLGACFTHAVEPMPEVIYLHVAPASRGLGVGRRLLAEAGRWTLERAPSLFYVTGGDNQPARRVCEAVGFRLHSRVHRACYMPAEGGGS